MTKKTSAPLRHQGKYWYTFAYLDGQMYLGDAHHMGIMNHLLENEGWTWDQLMTAKQCWGWIEAAYANVLMIRFTTDAARIDPEVKEDARRILSEVTGKEVAGDYTMQSNDEYAPNWDTNYGDDREIDHGKTNVLKISKTAATQVKNFESYKHPIYPYVYYEGKVYLKASENSGLQEIVRDAKLPSHVWIDGVAGQYQPATGQYMVFAGNQRKYAEVGDELDVAREYLYSGTPPKEAAKDIGKWPAETLAKPELWPFVYLQGRVFLLGKYGANNTDLMKQLTEQKYIKASELMMCFPGYVDPISGEFAVYSNWYVPEDDAEHIARALDEALEYAWITGKS